jgi:hypothetical protein
LLSRLPSGIIGRKGSAITIITITGAAATGIGIHIGIAVMMDAVMTADGTGTAGGTGGDDDERALPIGEMNSKFWI